WLATPVLGQRIGTVEEGSPAASVGLVPGDEVKAVNGEQFDLFGGRSVQLALREHAGTPVSILVRHADGTEATIVVTLRPSSQADEHHGALGVGQLQPTFDYAGHDIGTSVGIAGSELTRWGGLILSGLGQLVGGFITNPTAPPPAAGPI